MNKKYYREKDYIVIIAKHGEKILISEESLLDVFPWCWCVSKTGYAVARVNGVTTKMHRLLLNPNANEVIDHINGNTLDNRLCNLRKCTQKENSRNNRVSKNSKSGCLGIRITKSGKYRPRIMVDKKEITGIPLFETLEEAIEERKRLEQKYFGEFAPCNKGATWKNEIF